MEESKNQLRSTGLKLRASADPAACMNWSRQIQCHVLEHPAYRDARYLAAYQALGNEVGTRLLIDHALQNDKQVFVPASGTQEPQTFVQLCSGDISPGDVAGLPVAFVATELADRARDSLLVLVPAVLFDPQGQRVGRGGGWYDRVLQALDGRGVYFGLGYEFQIISRVPVRTWDQRVHFVITESRVIDCGVQPSLQLTR